MNNTVYPCLWFDDDAKEAVDFYCGTFDRASMVQQAGVVTIFSVEGCQFMALQGGPMFRPNATMSFYTICESEAEIDRVWAKLENEGKILMPLSRYDWSQKYGWVEDKFGVSWQLTLGNISDTGQKIVPTLMFTGDNFGKAEEAISLYTTLFPNSEVHFLSRYSETDSLQAGKINHGQFSLFGQRIAAMDSGIPHDFAFTEGNSLVVGCKTQKEIDTYWNGLVAGGGSESQCGWLKDKFGLSWQIVPAQMGDWMRDPEKAKRVTQAFLKMKKLDLEVLRNA